MQQTEKYKLNLIEKDDPFSPDGLNQNTRKVENALIAHEGAVKEVTDGLGRRITVLEGFKFACGSFTILKNQETTVQLGFTPVAVFVRHNHYRTYILDYLAVSNMPEEPLEIIENGFKAKSIAYFDTGTFNYIAFGANQ